MFAWKIVVNFAKKKGVRKAYRILEEDFKPLKINHEKTIDEKNESESIKSAVRKEGSIIHC